MRFTRSWATNFRVATQYRRVRAAFPKWWGIAHVVLAFALAAKVFAVMVATHSSQAT